MPSAENDTALQTESLRSESSSSDRGARPLSAMRHPSVAEAMVQATTPSKAMRSIVSHPAIVGMTQMGYVGP